MSQKSAELSEQQPLRHSKLAILSFALACLLTGFMALSLFGFSTSTNDGRGFLIIYLIGAELLLMPLFVLVATISLFDRRRNTLFAKLSLLILAAQVLVPGVIFLVMT